MVVFVVGAFLELFLLCMMDSYESERFLEGKRSWEGNPENNSSDEFGVRRCEGSMN